ncbi:MAG: flavin reductase family protein [Rhodospirillales bacterium]|nr:flavin reductase family protein [Rhodospirillales bacterium]MBO6786658.1 flavin reductase family protein [Rhodospirillales bacterium]
MTVEPQQFRQALAKFASGVTVISTLSPDSEPIGVTVSAFSSLSLSPPLVLICLDQATSQIRAYTDGPAFCVNILAAGQEDVSNAFAFPGPVPPFRSVPFKTGVSGLPVILNTLASLECRREAVHPGGDHEIVVGSVVEATWNDALEPLIYAAGRYRSLAEPEKVT